MSILSDNFEDICQFDGDYIPGMYTGAQANAANCVAPEVYCPATRGCMNHYDPNWNDVCELMLRKHENAQTGESGFNFQIIIAILGFLLGFGIYLALDRYFISPKRQDSNQEILLSAHV
jgi:hypothetical protein